MKFSYFTAAALVSCSVLVALAMPATASAADMPQMTASDKSAILGADSNNNGVRDDLEPYLVANFSKNERVFRSVSNMLISVQYALKATTRAESSRAHSMTLRSQECMASLGVALLPYKDAVEKIESLVLNTPERQKAYQEHASRLAGTIFAENNAPEWDDGCMKRVDEA